MLVDHATTASPGDETLTLGEFLPYQLSILAETVSRLFARQYEQRFDLGVPEWRVMAVLGEGGALPTQDVITRTRMDRVRVSRAAIRLVDKGLVRRMAQPDDQRARRLDLTAPGVAIYREIVPLALALQAKLVQQLTREEAMTLDRLIAKLLAATDGLQA